MYVVVLHRIKNAQTEPPRVCRRAVSVSVAVCSPVILGLQSSKNVMRALGGLPVSAVVGMWLPTSATP